MDRKFKAWQKYLQFIVFLLILIVSAYKGIYSEGDYGIVVILSFLAFLLFAILFVAALFPATWRMTVKQKEKIKDLSRYQESYTSGLVVLNIVISMIMVFLIWTIA